MSLVVQNMLLIIFGIPIKKSFEPIQRRMDIFYAGINSLDSGAIAANAEFEKPKEGIWIIEYGAFYGCLQ
ncbi:MAG: hypothetical protein CM1200mP1_14010 [Candidatus Neomarinimicrobiota bacterium]|nr:MAG: hypothetical protein CM1200mP1_14010 [Candidatus Neomarinimicrobiota bacterium]